MGSWGNFSRRKRALTQGVTDDGARRKSARVEHAAQTPAPVVPAAPDDWFSQAQDAAATNAEVLLFALLLIVKTKDDSAMTSWCAEVLTQADDYDRRGDAWSPPTHWGVNGAILKPLADALSCDSEDTLGKVGKVMHEYDGPGRVAVALPGSVLQRHLARYRFRTGSKAKRRLSGPVRDAKGNKSPRQNQALVRIARLLDDRTRRARLSAWVENTTLDDREHELNTANKAELKHRLDQEHTEHRKELEQSRAEHADAVAMYEQILDAHEKAHAEELGTLRKLLARHRSTKSAALRRSREARQKYRSKLADQKAELAEKAVADAEAVYEDMVDRLRVLKNNMAERARCAEAAAAKADKNAEHAKAARARAERELADLTALEGDAHDYAQALLDQVPEFKMVGKGKGHGRGHTWPTWLRALIMELLVNGTRPSAVMANVRATASYLTPWLRVRGPRISCVRRMRRELRTVVEALAAYRVARARRVRQLGTDGTERNQQSLLTGNLLIENADGEFEDVVMRSAALTPGKTAQIEAETLEENIFKRGAAKLDGWRAVHVELFGPEAAADIPESDRVALDRLGGGGMVSSDTCNQARALTRLIVEMVAARVEAKIGPESWAAMTKDEQQAAIRCHQGHCWNHLRNVWLDGGSSAVSAYLKIELAASLDKFHSTSRVGVDLNDVVRSVYKEFSDKDGAYAKGKGVKEFEPWMRITYPKEFSMPEERADGSRQDLAYLGAVPLFVNRKYYVRFLDKKLREEGHANVLEDCIFAILSSLEMIASIRAHAIITLLIIYPMRFLAGTKTLDDWSPYSMAGVADVIEQTLEKAAADGRTLMQPVSIFAEYQRTQPKFREYLAELKKETVVSPDGSIPHPWWSLVEAELFEPQDETNKRSTELTVEILQVMCAAMLAKMRDPKGATRAYLSSQDGELTIGKTADAHADTVGCHCTNDILAESVFGVFTEIFNRSGMLVASASGIAQARSNKDFTRPDVPCYERRRRAAAGAAASSAADAATERLGIFHSISARLRESLLEYSRRSFEQMRELDRADQAAHDAYWQKRREEELQKQREKLEGIYMNTCDFFEKYEHCDKNATAIKKALKSKQSEAAKKEYLKTAIKIRVEGFGWTDLKTQWSSGTNAEIGTVDHLTKHLLDIVKQEKRRGIPDSPPVPPLQRMSTTQLGTITPEVEELNTRDEQEQEAFVQSARKKRAARPEFDDHTNRQPATAPSLASLKGAHLEVCDWVETPEDGHQLHWFSGVVKQVSDGTVTRASGRGVYAEGTVLIHFDEQPFDKEPGGTAAWTVLPPTKFNKNTRNSWRFDLDFQPV